MKTDEEYLKASKKLQEQIHSLVPEAKKEVIRTSHVFVGFESDKK